MTVMDPLHASAARAGRLLSWCCACLLLAPPLRAQTPASDNPPSAPFEQSLNAVLALEDDLELDAALSKARQLLPTLDDSETRERVESVVTRLEKERALRDVMLAAIQRLDSDNNWKLLTARREIESAGSTALVFLRDAVRHGLPNTAEEAAVILVEMEDERAVQVLAERMESDHLAPLRKPLLRALVSMYDKLEPARFFELLQTALKGDGTEPMPVELLVSGLPRIKKPADVDDALIDVFMRPSGADAGALVPIVAVAVQRGRVDMAQAITDYVLARQPFVLPPPTARAKAERIGTLIRLGADSEHVANAFHSMVYSLVQNDSQNALKVLATTGLRLDRLLPEGEAKEKTRTAMLDAAFLGESYDLALEIVDRGIPQRDEIWHTMTRQKILAYRALKNGELAKATDGFRKIMDYYKNHYKPVRDPTLGITYTKEVLMGRNVKRIGDILTSAGDADGAAQAYEEARQYYRTALQNVAEESPEAKLIRSELAGVPDAATED